VNNWLMNMLQEGSDLNLQRREDLRPLITTLFSATRSVKRIVKNHQSSKYN